MCTISFCSMKYWIIFRKKRNPFISKLCLHWNLHPQLYIMKRYKRGPHWLGKLANIQLEVKSPRKYGKWRRKDQNKLGIIFNKSQVYPVSYSLHSHHRHHFHCAYSVVGFFWPLTFLDPLQVNRKMKCCSVCMVCSSTFTPSLVLLV